MDLNIRGSETTSGSGTDLFVDGTVLEIVESRVFSFSRHSEREKRSNNITRTVGISGGSESRKSGNNDFIVSWYHSGTRDVNRSGRSDGASDSGDI
jgi:hypothetical protein